MHNYQYKNYISFTIYFPVQLQQFHGSAADVLQILALSIKIGHINIKI